MRAGRFASDRSVGGPGRGGLAPGDSPRGRRVSRRGSHGADAGRAPCGINTEGRSTRLGGVDALRLAARGGQPGSGVSGASKTGRLMAAGRSQVGGKRELRHSGLLTRHERSPKQGKCVPPTVKLSTHARTAMLCGAGEFEPEAGPARRGIADAEGTGSRGPASRSCDQPAEPLWYWGAG